MKARVEVRLDYCTVALHAMYDTVHRALINRYTHTYRSYSHIFRHTSGYAFVSLFVCHASFKNVWTTRVVKVRMYREPYVQMLRSFCLALFVRSNRHTVFLLRE